MVHIASGVGAINQSPFSIPTSLAFLIGAPILLAIVNFFQRGRARYKAMGLLQ